MLYICGGGACSAHALATNNLTVSVEFESLQMATNDLAELRQHVDSMQQRIDCQDAMIRSQSGTLGEIRDMLRGVVIDMRSIKEQNRSSSSSISRYMCPMHCGADFKKVSCLSVVAMFSSSAGYVSSGSSLQGLQNQQAHCLIEGI